MSDWHTVEVSLCINDRNGAPTGRCAQLEVNEIGEFDRQVVIEWDPLDTRGQPRCRLGDGELRFSRIKINVTDWGRYVGNIHWDRCRMPVEEARRLVRVALKNGVATEHVVGGLFEAEINAQENR